MVIDIKCRYIGHFQHGLTLWRRIWESDYGSRSLEFEPWKESLYFLHQLLVRLREIYPPSLRLFVDKTNYIRVYIIMIESNYCFKITINNLSWLKLVTVHFPDRWTQCRRQWKTMSWYWKLDSTSVSLA